MRGFSQLLSFALVAAFLPATSTARTWHIAPDGSGDAPTIQAGIDSAVAGDTVSLRNGVFTGVGNRAVDFRGKAILVCSESGVPDSCVIDCEGADRAFLFVGGEGQGSVLRMVQVIRGWKNDRNGGAIYCEDSPRFVGCVFRDNSCGMYGGAIYSLGSPTFSSCVFEGNEAPYGGAVYCKGDMGTPVPEFVECAFVENRAGIRGGAAYLWFSRSLFDRCRFTMNASVDRGGAIASEEWSHPTVTACVFEDNSGKHGGAFVSYARGGASISGCSFLRNTAEDVGGAVVLNDWSTAEIVSCLFAENQGARGGAVAFLNGTTPVFESCTLVENRGTVSGGCVYVAGGTSPTVEHTVLVGSTEGAAAFCEPNGSVTLLCCDVYGNAGGDWVNCLTGQDALNGNLSVDPLFCFPDTGNFYLHADSPCLNASGCGQVGAFGEGCPVVTQVASPEHGAVPAFPFLAQNEPNPFNPTTKIHFALSHWERAVLAVYDLSGRRIAVLADGRFSPGEFDAMWNGTDGSGVAVPSGIYFARLQAGKYTAMRKIVLLR